MSHQTSLTRRRLEGSRGEDAPSLGPAEVARLAAVGYDADRAPEAAPWLGVDEDTRRGAIALYHREKEPHAPPESPHLHATCHLIVENQLAAGHPEVTAAFTRLMGEGLSRHDALHAVGTVALHMLWEVAEEGRLPDEAEYAAAVAALTRDDWLAMVGPPKHRARRGRRKR